ncbi:MAG: hypothetical protein AAFV53_07645 [Myxococcota bacterium]
MDLDARLEEHPELNALIEQAKPWPPRLRQSLEEALKGPTSPNHRLQYWGIRCHREPPTEMQVKALAAALDAGGWPDRQRAPYPSTIAGLRADIRALFPSLWDNSWNAEYMELLPRLLKSESIKYVSMTMNGISSAVTPARGSLDPVLEALPPDLIGLELRWAELSIPQLKIIAALPNLQHLTLHSCFQGVEGVRALLDGDGLNALTHLDLDSCKIGTAGVKAIVNAPVADNLTGLGLGGSGGGGEGVRAVLTSPRLTGLTWLNLRTSSWADVDLDGADIPAVQNIEHLFLNTRLRSKTVLQILDAVDLPRLRSLGLEGTLITAIELDTILNRLGEDCALTVLELEGPTLQAPGWKRLAEWPGLSRLERLTIGGYIGDEDVGFQALMTSPHPIQEDAIQVHRAKFPTTAYLFAMSPAIARRDSFVKLIPKKILKQVAEDVGIDVKKSDNRRGILNRIIEHNKSAPPERQIDRLKIPEGLKGPRPTSADGDSNDPRSVHPPLGYDEPD